MTDQVPICTRLGCDRPGTHTLHPQYGRPSRWCLEHGERRYETEQFFSNRQVFGPRLTPERRLPLPRPVEAAAG